MTRRGPMRSLITCSSCGGEIPANARFCSSCGEPRASTAKLLRRDARDTGIPYEELVQAAKAADADEASSRETVRQIIARLTELEQRLTVLAEQLPSAELPEPAAPEALGDLPIAQIVATPEAISEVGT